MRKTKCTAESDFLRAIQVRWNVPYLQYSFWVRHVAAQTIKGVCWKMMCACVGAALRGRQDPQPS